MNDNEIYDITIIGSGPTGLFAAFYAGLRELKTKIIEALPEPGGQLAVLYPEKFIYDVPGHPKIMAKDLVRTLLDQTHLFDPAFVYDTRVDTLTQVSAGDETVWRLGTDHGAHLSRTVVITAGIGAFVPNRIDKPGVAEFDNKGVYYFVKDKRPFRGKRMLIIGGGDTAVDWCLNLKDWAKEITLIHRRDEFRAHESSLAELRASSVNIKTFYELKRINGNATVESAVIYDNRVGTEEEIPVDVVLVNIGFKAALGPINSWGLEMFDNRHIRTDGYMETNLPGVFAAGDIAAIEGSTPLNLIVTGFGQAAIAANAAKMRVDPKSRLFPGHSSEMRL